MGKTGCMQQARRQSGFALPCWETDTEDKKTGDTDADDIDTDDKNTNDTKPAIPIPTI